MTKSTQETTSPLFNTGAGTKLFQIYEPDLAILEKALPILHEACSMSPAYQRADVQIAIEEAKKILSDVRWNYGPYSHVERVSVKDGD